jgi:sugar transferase (PEP-CTERM system associated)
MLPTANQSLKGKVTLKGLIESLLLIVPPLVLIKLWYSSSGAVHSAAGSGSVLQLLILLIVTLAVAAGLLNNASSPSYRGRLLFVLQVIGTASLALLWIVEQRPSSNTRPTSTAVCLAVAGSIAIVSRVVLLRIWRAVPAGRVVIMGTGELAWSVAEELRNHSQIRTDIVGFIKEETFSSTDGINRANVLGTAVDLEEVVQKSKASKVVIAMENRRGVLPTAALVRLKVQGVKIEEAATTLANLTGRVALSSVRPSWFAFSDGFRRPTLTLALKRMLDVCAALAGLALSLPVMIAVAIAVRLESKGPILYRQVRVGWRNKNFKVLKFRSMRVDAEVNGARWAAQDDPRVTRVGRMIRKYRLDELPQFINVLRGDMSFVGPRPERPVFVEQLREHIPYYDERHSMRPGLTGWAQVRYRYGASIEDAYCKLEYDLFYLKHLSLWFDLAIIGSTARVVLTGKLGR